MNVVTLDTIFIMRSSSNCSLQGPGSKKTYLLKPQTFMNRSGESARAAMDYYKIPVNKLMVVHDDIELDFGQVRVRQGGGLAGHNGLKSVVQHVGSRDFFRLSLGISRPAFGNVSSYVLSGFTPDEKAVLPRVLSGAAEALDYCISNNLIDAAEKYSKWTIL